MQYQSRTSSSAFFVNINFNLLVQSSYLKLEICNAKSWIIYSKELFILNQQSNRMLSFSAAYASVHAFCLFTPSNQLTNQATLEVFFPKNTKTTLPSLRWAWESAKQKSVNNLSQSVDFSSNMKFRSFLCWVCVPSSAHPPTRPHQHIWIV